MSLAHLIHSVATRDPERTAVLRGEAAVSYGTLAQEVDAAGALLLSRRVQAGDTVALALSQEPSWQWVLLLGALRIGAWFLPAEPKLSPLGDQASLAGRTSYFVASLVAAYRVPL